MQGQGPLRHAAIPNNYRQISQKRNIIAGEMYTWRYVYNVPVTKFGLHLP